MTMPTAPMTLQILSRPVWHGTPHEVGQYFLRENRREAKVVKFTHQVKWKVLCSLESIPVYVFATSGKRQMAAGYALGLH
jgi:hypothetical protein